MYSTRWHAVSEEFLWLHQRLTIQVRSPRLTFLVHPSVKHGSRFSPISIRLPNFFLSILPLTVRPTSMLHSHSKLRLCFTQARWPSTMRQYPDVLPASVRRLVSGLSDSLKTSGRTAPRNGSPRHTRLPGKS